jgi:hypothetical protein
VQGVHLYQREVARIVERAELFDGVRVHFQGARLHALFYRRINKLLENNYLLAEIKNEAELERAEIYQSEAEQMSNSAN